MTSPENPERPTATGEPATPPWQRLSKETRNGTSELPNGQVGENVLYSESRSDRPVVTGTAAQGLFGNPAAEPPDDALAGLRGQETVSVANAAAPKGRSAPSALRRPGRGPRRASLQVKRFDPWSVL